MSVLTSVQVKQVAKFLTASCAKIPQKSNSPTHGQWLEVIAHASGFRDWNAMKAIIANDPVLDNNTARWPNAHWTFFGVARVLMEGLPPVYQLAWSVNREIPRTQVSIELAKKIRALAKHLAPHDVFQYSQPDTRLSDGSIEYQWKNRARGCPIVITSKNHRVSIHLWWLSERYQLPENIPVWARDSSPVHTVDFNSSGDVPFHEYKEDEPNDSLTNIFLTQLTGKRQDRRKCVFVPYWTISSELPKPLQVEEGSALASPTDVISGSTLTELREAANTYNTKLGLSSIDTDAITERYKFAEQQRNEDDYSEFSGVYDD